MHVCCEDNVVVSGYILLLLSNAVYRKMLVCILLCFLGHTLDLDDRK